MITMLIIVYSFYYYIVLTVWIYHYLMICSVFVVGMVKRKYLKQIKQKDFFFRNTVSLIKSKVMINEKLYLGGTVEEIFEKIGGKERWQIEWQVGQFRTHNI